MIHLQRGDYMATEARRRAVKKYDKTHTKQIHLKLNIKSDANIIEHLDRQANVQGYIKQLIKDDMDNDSLSDR